MEKLQLSAESSVEEPEESVEEDEDELQKFQELKQKMILLDRAELGSAPEGDTNPKSHLPSLALFKR